MARPVRAAFPKNRAGTVQGKVSLLPNSHRTTELGALYLTVVSFLSLGAFKQRLDEWVEKLTVGLLVCIQS